MPIMSEQPDRALAWLELQQATSRLRSELSRRVMEHAGMSATEHDVLWHLANDVDRRMTMSDLAERAMITPSGATRLVARLEREGWVRREVDADNRRVVYAVLTPAGARATRTGLKPIHQARQELFDDRLTDTDVADLRRILGKLLRRLDTVD
jgi:DNA-binding MarR family transcriptional regulator